MTEYHPHEIKVLKALDKEYSPSEIAEATGLPVDAVLRAASWLKTKKLVEVKENIFDEVRLTDEGLKYLGEGLPERRIVDSIKGDECRLADIKIGKKEIGIGLGWLRKKGLASLDKGVIKVTDRKETVDEKLLKKFKDKEVVLSSELDDELNQGLELLKSRQNVVSVRDRKELTLAPTKEGLRTAEGLEVGEDVASQLTPRMLVSGGWRKLKFRPYDTSLYVRPSYPVKKHPLQREINRIRQIFVGLGFNEVRGPLVESAFWNFDALFQPQDHPARDMHDTFYLRNPSSVEIPGFNENADKVKETHENGWTTGSLGWRYKWSKDVARKTLLRTHTTAVTARYLSTLGKEDLPAKVFSIGKVFRNEATDYKHLPEFYQVEGIVADPGVNFRNLLGILKQFYDEMGFERIRFRPAYFPYTEMSVEPEVYLEERGEWIELGGAGIFRPEVVKPLLGFDCPVLAWGLGVDRVVTLKLGLKDIRELYISDLDWLRKSKVN